MAEQRIDVVQELREQNIDVLNAGAEQNIEIGSEPSVLHGIDGVSPIATVTQTETGATISITDRDGTTTATITNGQDGAPGRDGSDGQDGQDGRDGRDGRDGSDGAAATISVGSTTTGAAGTQASVTNSGTSSAAVLNFTIPRGATGATGASGQNGRDGADGYSPTATVTKSGDTATITITDKNGTTTAQVKDGSSATVTVDSALSTSSTNPVQNKVITNALNNKADSSAIPTKTSDLQNDSGFITGYTETDPTVPSWAKQASKPSYDYSEIANTPTIPTKTSDLQNDSGYITSSSLPTKTSDLVNDGSDNTSTYLEADETAYRTTSIPYGECDSTSTATVFTATVPGITELRDGVCMWLKNGVVTSATGFTININGLGAKPVYSNMAAATRDTTLFNVAYTMFFVYDSDRVDGGCWILYRGYDSNTNTLAYQVRTNSQTMPMSSITYRYRLLFTSADGEHYVPANNSTSTNATASRAVCQDKIDPFGAIYYYGTTASVAANARPAAANLWQQYVLSLGYSFNRTGAALTLTSYKPVYVKAAPQSDGSAIIDSTTPYVQDLPTTADGKIYIFLGIAYSATNIELTMNHPIYEFKGGMIRPYTNQAIDSALDSTSTNPVQNSVITAAIGDVESVLATLNSGGGAQ